MLSSTRTPGLRPQVIYAAIGAMVRRPHAITGEQIQILVARERSTVGRGQEHWIGGIVRLSTVGEAAVNTIVLQDGRMVVVGALRTERELDSYRVDLVIEGVVRAAEIEADVERMLRDPEARELFQFAAEFYPDPA